MIITITGQNTFLRLNKQRELSNKFITKHGAEAVERVDCEEAELSRILESLTAYSLFSMDKLVILRTPSAHKAFIEGFDKLIGQIPETTDVLIIEPKIDKRITYYKTLKNKTDFYEFQELKQPELSRWLVSFANEQGGNINSQDANYLIDRVGPNQQFLAKEAVKLVTYQPQITQENIDLLTDKTPQGSVFELLDAAFAGNAKRALNLYREQREMRVEPLVILGMMAWQLNILAIVKTAGNRTSQQIASEAKLNPFVVQKASGITRRLTLLDIKNLVSQTLNLDIRLKRESLDTDEALSHLLLNIAV